MQILRSLCVGALATVLVPAIVHASGSVPCGMLIEISDFTGSTDLSLVGSASIVNGAVRLTPANGGAAGAAWYITSTGALLDGFDTTFTFTINGEGDGMAFVIQSASETAIGDGGSGMGYAWNGNAGIPSSVAIELDTFSFTGEFQADHVSIQTRGAQENSYDDADSLGHAELPIDLNDGQPHTLRVRYVPGTLDVYLDGDPYQLVSVTIDLESVLGDSILDVDGCAWVGFTAGNGGAVAEHDINAWSFRDGTEPCGPIQFEEFPWGGETTAPGPLILESWGSGPQPLRYQWFKDGQPLVSGGRISGATSPRLTIDPVLPADSGLYDVSISNECGGTSTGSDVTVVPWCPGDANQDGAVSFADITSVLANFGADCS